MTVLTDKTRSVLADMFRQPTLERSARDISAGTGLAPNVVGNLLGRLISMGFVLDRRDEGGTRLFRLAPQTLTEAADAAGVLAPVDSAASRGKPAQARPGRDFDEEVWTVSDVRNAYKRGEVSHEFLAQVERAVAETVRNTTRT